VTEIAVIELREELKIAKNEITILKEEIDKLDKENQELKDSYSRFDIMDFSN